MDELAFGEVEVAIRDDDLLLVDLATRAGLAATDARGAATWMDADDRPSITDIAVGYRLFDRANAQGRPHHFASRSGSLIDSARLRSTVPTSTCSSRLWPGTSPPMGSSGSTQ
jgi:hypothetical protein